MRRKNILIFFILIVFIIVVIALCTFMVLLENTERIELDLKSNSIKYSDIPNDMINATIAIEDKRFWSHNGVDWIRTTSAVINCLNPFAKSYSGGSTITQQVIKNVTGEWQRTPQRKVKEILRAINLERDYSKEEILETYLNIISLGNGLYGIKDATNYYYSKNVGDLTLYECASVICITQNPTKWDPIKYPENNRERTTLVLSKMLKQNYITTEEYENALANN